jgi:hypothetical protein
MEVAQEILKQLGGPRRLEAMIGAHSFGYEGDALIFKFKNRKHNLIKISLNGSDLYDVEIGLTKGWDYKVKFEKGGVYADSLKSTIEQATGLYLSF